MEIVEMGQKPELLAEGIQYFWKCWGSDSNFTFYKDCIEHSLDAGKSLPKFYLALEDSRIIGSYALLTNDIISRQDLMPWLACLFVEESHRGKGLAGKLLTHGLQESRRKGFSHLYLSTDLIDFYEKKGWAFFANGFGVGGDEFKIYQKAT